MVVGKGEKGISFEEIKSVCELNCFIEENKYEHDCFFHYTSAEAFRKIYEGKNIWLSDIAKSNDLIEKDHIMAEWKNPARKTISFSLGFSAPITQIDSIPMWYLYTKGVALKLDAHMIKMLVEESSVAIVDTKTSTKLVDLKKDDANLTIRDVVYYHHGDNNSTVDLFWHGKENHLIKYDEFKQYRIDNIFFFKDSSWRSEEEVRIIGEIDKKLIDESMTDIAISLTLPSNTFTEGSVIMGPESDDDMLYMQSHISCITYSSVRGKVRINNRM